MRLRLERDHACGKFLALPRQGLRVDKHAVALDAPQHGRGGHFDAAVDVLHADVRLQLRPQRLVDLQRHFAVFARILAGLGHIDLGKRNLVRALAAHVFIAQPMATQVALRQAFQAVRLVRFEHITLEQGVVHVAANRYAGVAKDMRVVLDVLAELGGARVFQPGLEARQHCVNRQLIGRACIGVAQRDVGGCERLYGERNADDAGGHGVERIGLGVDCGQLGRGDLRQPTLERSEAQNCFVVLLRRRRRRHRNRIVLHRFGQRGARCVAGFEFAPPRLESVARKKRHQGFTLHVAQAQCVERREARQLAAQIAIGAHRHQALALRQPVQRLAQVLAGNAFDRRGGGDHAVERTKVGDPLRGGLWADFFDARNVVDAVAHQRQVVDDALRRNAKLGLDAGDVERFIAHRVDQRDVLVDELRKVFVAGGDHHTMAAVRCERRQRSDRVVGFDAGHRQHRPTEQRHRLVDRVDLLHQRVGHGGALRLVLRVPLIAKRWAFRIEHTRRVLRVELLAQ